MQKLAATIPTISKRWTITGADVKCRNQATREQSRTAAISPRISLSPFFAGATIRRTDVVEAPIPAEQESHAQWLGVSVDASLFLFDQQRCAGQHRGKCGYPMMGLPQKWARFRRDVIPKKKKAADPLSGPEALTNLSSSLTRHDLPESARICRDFSRSRRKGSEK